MNIRKVLTAGLFVVLILFSDCTYQKPDSITPTNVILMIGDGMGVAHVFAGLTANGGSLNLEKCQYTGFSKTQSSNRYCTDSGAGATAIATGKKTKNGSVGVDSQGRKVKNIAEYADESGMYTGLIATCEITDATPGSFVAHYPERDSMELIAGDFIDSGLELFIGGGRIYFQERYDQRDLLQELEEKGYFVGSSLDEIGPETKLPMAILTDARDMPAVHRGRGDLLPRATGKAIELLSENQQGFFLMVEGSQIDWAGHDGDIEYLVAEMIDFDKAIGEALQFAMKDGNTLVIVTADHETGGFAVQEGDFDTGEVKGSFVTEDHTGVMVPVFAYGPGAEQFAGIYENTAIFEKIMALLDL